MPKVALLSRVKAKQGKGEELIAAFRPVFELVEDEPGTLLYVLHRSSDDPDLFWVCELYADDDAFAAHRTSDAMCRLPEMSDQAVRIRLENEVEVYNKSSILSEPMSE
jgi:(4S)-4-hydroxy-5-phosphonooxypentane-2,3-dione isomerase